MSKPINSKTTKKVVQNAPVKHTFTFGSGGWGDVKVVAPVEEKKDEEPPAKEEEPAPVSETPEVQEAVEVEETKQE